MEQVRGGVDDVFLVGREKRNLLIAFFSPPVAPFRYRVHYDHGRRQSAGVLRWCDTLYTTPSKHRVMRIPHDNDGKYLFVELWLEGAIVSIFKTHGDLKCPFVKCAQVETAADTAADRVTSDFLLSVLGAAEKKSETTLTEPPLDIEFAITGSRHYVDRLDDTMGLFWCDVEHWTETHNAWVAPLSSQFKYPMAIYTVQLYEKRTRSRYVKDLLSDERFMSATHLPAPSTLAHLPTAPAELRAQLLDVLRTVLRVNLLKTCPLPDAVSRRCGYRDKYGLVSFARPSFSELDMFSAWTNPCFARKTGLRDYVFKLGGDDGGGGGAWMIGNTHGLNMDGLRYSNKTVGTFDMESDLLTETVRRINAARDDDDEKLLRNMIWTTIGSTAPTMLYLSTATNELYVDSPMLEPGVCMKFAAAAATDYCDPDIETLVKSITGYSVQINDPT